MKTLLHTIGIGLVIWLMTALTASAILDNTPPNPPEITGPTSGIIKTTYIYKVLVSDPDENDELLKLEMDFGDGVITETCGCSQLWQNGETVNVSHEWRKPGTYSITGRVMDVNGEWSDWSEPFSVSLPRSKHVLMRFQELIDEIVACFSFLQSFSPFNCI
jgi:hypothetical protein